MVRLPDTTLPVKFTAIISPPNEPSLVATTLPPVLMLPPVMFPVAPSVVPSVNALAVILPVPPRALLTTRLLRLPTVCNELLTTLAANKLPVNRAALELTTNPLSPAPLPTKALAVTTPLLVILPVTLSCPEVVTLPPVILPVAARSPTVLMFCPRILPEALIAPAVLKLPPCTFPVTLTLVNIPTEVKLEEVTLELSVLPVISAAGALDVTPVS